MRTIVVWKHSAQQLLLIDQLQLRKNHSGMETLVDIGSITESISCVRTIVVWKPELEREKEELHNELRKNHSGMETGLR